MNTFIQPLHLKIPTAIARNYLSFCDHPIAKVLFQVLTDHSTNTSELLPTFFDNKIDFFKNNCDYSTQNETGERWVKKITFPEGSISEYQEEFSVNFVLRNHFFESNTFHESYFVGEGNEMKDKYFYFGLYDVDDTEFENPFLSIRTDLIGKNAELSTIEKSEHISGNQLKEIADRLMRSLGVEVSYIFDASSIILNPQEWLSLKMMLALSSDDRLTWYAKNGYKISEFIRQKSFEYPEQPRLMTQSTRHFHIALEKLRSTKIADVYTNIFASIPSVQAKTMHLFNKYIKLAKQKSPKIQFSDWFGNSTIHDLSKALMQASRKASEVFKTNLDLLDFQKHFLTSYEYEYPIKKTLSDFNLAINILNRHYIWQKNFTSQNTTSDYQRFIQEPHESFDEMVGDLSLPHGLLWHNIEIKQPDASLKRPLEITENLEPPKKRPRIDPTKSIEPASLVTAPTESVHDYSEAIDPPQTLAQTPVSSPWFQSPEEFVSEIPDRFSNVFKRRLDNLKSIFACTKIDHELSWKARVSIPQGWNSNPYQKQTSLFLEIRDFQDISMITFREEYTEGDSMEISIEERPIVYSWMISSEYQFDEFPSNSDSINKDALQSFAKSIAFFLYPKKFS